MVSIYVFWKSQSFTIKCYKQISDTQYNFHIKHLLTHTKFDENDYENIYGGNIHSKLYKRITGFN